jgi:hypothetical protein
MYNENIYFLVRKSLTYSSLDIREFQQSDQFTQFIKNISLGIISDDEILNANFITGKLKEDKIAVYVFINGHSRNALRTMPAIRDDKEYYIVFRYSEDSEEDKDTLERIFNEIKFFTKAIYGEPTPDASCKELFITLTPYMIFCKLYDDLNMAFYSKEKVSLQDVLNSRENTSINELIDYIIKEKPDFNELFSINSYLKIFKIKQ